MPDEFEEDERCDERAGGGREDDETVPKVDRTSALVEEVEVPNEHSTPALSYGRKETIRNASGKERFEVEASAHLWGRCE